MTVPGPVELSVEWAERVADFLFVPNEGGSLRLRWEITEPLKPGEGGVVRFRCKVR